MNLRETIKAFVNTKRTELDVSDQLHVEIGERIKKRRKELGLSQKDLSFQCNFERTGLAMIETGRQGIPAYKLALLCVALNVTADFLLFGEGE